jgi:8-oxo-dGTP diphosphatase
MAKISRGKPRRGAVAVIVENGSFLVIRRSQFVRAPDLLCFAGGTIERGETPQQAIERELIEELNLQAKATDHIWQSVTGWGTKLEWVLVDRHPDSQPVANLSEVAEWMWLDPPALLNHPKLLPSVPAFFNAWARQQFKLPERAGQPDPNWLTFP